VSPNPLAKFPQPYPKGPVKGAFGNLSKKDQARIIEGKKKSGQGTKSPKINRFPPPLITSFIQTIKRRFIPTGAVSGNFTIQSGILQFVVATTAIIVEPIVNMWRIAKIEGWCTQDPTNAGNEAYIQLAEIGVDSVNNTFSTPPRVWSDSSNASNHAAHICLKGKSTDGILFSWHTSDNVNTAQTLFSLGCTVLSVIDITFQVVICFAGVGRNFSQACVGASVGTLYARVPITNLLPVGVNVI